MSVEIPVPYANKRELTFRSVPSSSFDKNWAVLGKLLNKLGVSQVSTLFELQ
jgi:hypothetical protein